MLCRGMSKTSSIPMANQSGVPGVFKSLSSILSTLEEHAAHPGVAELLATFNRGVDSSRSAETFSKYPLVVYEGLDGSGKSLLTKLTAKRLGGVKTSTPPDSVVHLRPYFDKVGVDRVLRRAFYSLGNYMAAYKIQTMLETSPVVMDRFWHSTAAYAIAELNDNYDIPEDTFTWPSDLLKPDLIVFLTVSENVRLERMSRRKNFTAEEDQLKENSSYRQRLTETFSKMKSPSLQFVNCDGVAKLVVENVVTLLKNKVGSTKQWPP